jgi:hypothetical protein
MVASYADNYPHMNVYIQDLGRLTQPDSEWAADNAARMRSYESLVHSILSRARSDGTLRTDLPLQLCALALFGMVNWMHRWYRPTVQWTPKEIAASYYQIFMGGYGAQR